MHEPLKLALALIGVALAVALVALLLALKEGIDRQATTYEDHAGADVYVAASDTRTFATPGASPLPASLGGKLAAVPGVKEAAPITDGLTILNLHDHRVATLLIGFEPGRLGGPWDMSDGRPPRTESDIAVDRVLAGAHGIDVGEMIHLRGQELRVVGLTDRTASWMTPLIFVTRREANHLQRQRDTASFFLLKSDGRSARELAGDVARRFPRLRVMTRDRISAESSKLVTRSFDPILNVMVVIALGVGTLVIGLTTYGFVGERRREYGALKAIGERAGRLYRLVSLQALAIAVAGLAAGTVTARLAAAGIHAAWPKFLFVSLPSHYAVLVVATFAMGLAGALVPVRVLARLDPAEAFRK